MKINPRLITLLLTGTISLLSFTSACKVVDNANTIKDNLKDFDFEEFVTSPKEEEDLKINEEVIDEQDLSNAIQMVSTAPYYGIYLEKQALNKNDILSLNNSLAITNGNKVIFVSYEKLSDNYVTDILNNKQYILSNINNELLSVNDLLNGKTSILFMEFEDNYEFKADDISKYVSQKEMSFFELFDKFMEVNGFVFNTKIDEKEALYENYLRTNNQRFPVDSPEAREEFEKVTKGMPLGIDLKLHNTIVLLYNSIPSLYVSYYGLEDDYLVDIFTGQKLYFQDSDKTVRDVLLNKETEMFGLNLKVENVEEMSLIYSQFLDKSIPKSVFLAAQNELNYDWDIYAGRFIWPIDVTNMLLILPNIEDINADFAPFCYVNYSDFDSQILVDVITKMEYPLLNDDNEKISIRDMFSGEKIKLFGHKYRFLPLTFWQYLDKNNNIPYSQIQKSLEDFSRVYANPYPKNEIIKTSLAGPTIPIEKVFVLSNLAVGRHHLVFYNNLNDTIVKDFLTRDLYDLKNRDGESLKVMDILINFDNPCYMSNFPLYPHVITDFIDLIYYITTPATIRSEVLNEYFSKINGMNYNDVKNHSLKP